MRARVGLGRAYVLGGAALRMKWLGAKLRQVTTKGGLRFPYVHAGYPRRGQLVWLHGFADHPVTFLEAAGHLLNDYEIFAPAMPGFAGPRPRDATYTFAAYTRWLTEFLDALRLDGVHLAGNSLGGAAALGIALESPQRLVSLSVVDNAGVHVDGVRSLTHEVLEGKILFEVRTKADYDRFVQRVYHRPPKVPSVVRDFLYEEISGRADWYCKLILDLQQGEKSAHADNPAWLHHRLSEIQTPTQVIWGEHDSFFPLPLGELTAEKIPGATLHVLPDTGHCPHIERPEQLANLLQRFAETSAAH